MAKGKQLRRRSHLALKAVQLLTCERCKKMIRPHVVCRYCGFYKGREVINVAAIALKKAEKRKQRQK